MEWKRWYRKELKKPSEIINNGTPHNHKFKKNMQMEEVNYYCF